MKRKDLPIVALIVLVLATIIEDIMATIFGADIVFCVALISLPFVLVWCLLTDTKKKPTI
jgi:hypothetical protein